jgi:hypothetical protein
VFLINKHSLLYPKNSFIEDAMCGAGGRMRGAVHSSLIFSLFLSFAKERKRPNRKKRLPASGTGSETTGKSAKVLLLLKRFVVCNNYSLDPATCINPSIKREIK